MAEKKTIIAVILGVSFISLVAALVAGFFDSISLLSDFTYLYGEWDERYDIAIGVFELIESIFGIAFVAVFLLLKKNRKKAVIIASVAFVAFIIVSLIVLKVILPEYENDYGKWYEKSFYALFTGYMTTAITVMVSSVLLVVSYILLLQPKQAQATDTAQTDSEQSAQSNASQSEN